MKPEPVCRVIGDKRLLAQPLPLEKRLSSFEEAVPALSLEDAVAEAMRCSASSPCVYCEVCQLICPDLAITRDPQTRSIVIDLDYCKGCGLCARYCPHGAIEMVVDD